MGPQCRERHALEAAAGVDVDVDQRFAAALVDAPHLPDRVAEPYGIARRRQPIGPPMGPIGTAWEEEDFGRQLAFAFA